MMDKVEAAEFLRAAALAVVLACMVVAGVPGRALADGGLAAGDSDALTCQAVVLEEGRPADVEGVLVRKEAHVDMDPLTEGTNVVYYVVELDEPAVLEALGEPCDVTSVQVGRVMSGYRAQQPLTPLGEMADPMLEPLVGKSVAASGTFTEYGGTFMWTPEQLKDATLITTEGAVQQEPMYRLYNPWTGEHFYTADATERAGVRDAGWFYEGIGWVAPGSSANPVYRLYNPYAGEHHYTLDNAERDSLIAAGWMDEGVGWFSAGESGVPVYREYNPNEAANNHNYTTDKDEHDDLVEIGWVDEGIGWLAIGADVEDPYAQEAEEDREALWQAEADAKRQAAVDAALAAGKDVYSGTVSILTGEECSELLLGKPIGQTGYLSYGHDPSELHAVLLVDPDTTVRAWSQFHGGKVVELRAGDGFGGIDQPAIGLLRDGVEDVDFWRPYDGRFVTVSIDPNKAVIPNELPANCCLVDPSTAELVG